MEVLAARAQAGLEELEVLGVLHDVEEALHVARLEDEVVIGVPHPEVLVPAHGQKGWQNENAISLGAPSPSPPSDIPRCQLLSGNTRRAPRIPSRACA